MNAHSRASAAQGLNRDVHLEPPSKETRESQMSTNELGGIKHAAVATDGVYVYVHSSAGLLKIGTGVGGGDGASPGSLVAEVKGYRAKERSSLACVGEYLFYRSPNIAPAAAIVLSTKAIWLPHAFLNILVCCST